MAKKKPAKTRMERTREVHGIHASELRYREVTPEHIDNLATEIDEIAAAYRVEAGNMREAMIASVVIDGGQQATNGIKLLNSYLTHVEFQVLRESKGVRKRLSDLN